MHVTQENWMSASDEHSTKLWEALIMAGAVIVNVVATAALNQELDLDELGKFRGILHDSEIYGGRVAYFKTSNMKGKVSLFASGKMISVGTTSEKEAFHELEYVKEFLVEKGFTKPIRLQPKIRNMVVTADFGESVDLEELSKNCKMIYEPEQFPGGILKIEEPYKITVLIFASGKAVIPGLRSSSQIKPIIQKLTNVIKAYRQSR